MVQKIEFLLADKSPLVCRGLASLCEDDGRFLCRGCYGTGQSFLDAILDSPIAIGVIGWVLPDMRGDDVLKALRMAGQGKRIVVYSGSPHPAVPRLAMALGGFGYCAKADPPEVLLDTLVNVSHGRISFPYVDVRALYSDPFAELTGRERELLKSLSRGWTNAQIAQSLGISENTVKFHLKNLYQKLSVGNRAGAVALYMEWKGDLEE